VEADALVALALRLSAGELAGIYKSQFSVLRRYESTTLFDSNGRQVSASHQAHGPFQVAADIGASGDDRAWHRVTAWLCGADVDVAPYAAPFEPADRVAAMTHAYWTFVERYDLTPPDIAERPS